MNTVNPLSQPTNPETYGPYSEFTLGLARHAQKIQDLEELKKTTEEITSVTKLACNRINELNSYRIISLIAIPVMFSGALIMYLLIYDNGDSVGLIKWLFGGSVIGLLFEAFWFPNKIREIERIANSAKNINDKFSDRLDKIELRISVIERPVSPQPSPAQPPAKTASKRTGKSR